MLIIDIVGLAAVETFLDHLGQAPHSQQIGALEQGAPSSRLRRYPPLPCRKWDKVVYQ